MKDKEKQIARIREKLAVLSTFPDLPFAEDLTGEELQQLYEIILKLENTLNHKPKLSIEQIKNMQHCIGWQRYNREPKRGIFNAYRNYYFCSVKEDWAEELCELGLMKTFNGYYGTRICYRVTAKGIKYLEELFSVKIKQDQEDICLGD